MIEDILDCIGINIGPHASSVAFAVFLYLIIIVSYVCVWYLLEPVSSFNEFDYEVRGFIRHYRETSWWWLTTFFASIIGLVIGNVETFWTSMLILGVFFTPSGYYFYRNSPFNLNCDYKPTIVSGIDSYSEEKQNIAYPDENGKYSLNIDVTTGSHIDEFQMDLKVPDGVNPGSIQTTVSEAELVDKATIKGRSPPGRDSFLLTLFLEEASGVGPEGRFIIFFDEGGNRELLKVRLMPSPQD
ncbi:hypothetical protein [Natrinema versiforme]|uniref:hypothetical protein n=1 Tax=Natrinema versiforme TaxID=88724 RepID=UPI0012679BB6|nr:hypothetical protein [Natrinema versiforme]